MIGKPENSVSPLCSGRLHPDTATIPFILGNNAVVVIKGVPAEVCDTCHEPFVAGRITDQVLALLRQLKSLHSEVSVVSYAEPVAA